MNDKLYFPFRLITVSVLILLICPLLIQDGMFMDGQQYACVSKNLSDGIGSFWFPHLSETWWKANSCYFMEHPPLIYGIQSLFFKVLGDSMYVERLYSFITAVITAFLIILIWKQVFKEDLKFKKLSWLPVLIWIIIPVNSWSFQNNLHENTMGVFILLSVLFLLKAFQNKRQVFLYLILSGISIFAAGFSKGIPGLFSIIAVGIYWLIFRNINLTKTIFYTLILILIPVIIFSILLINNDAYESLSFYLNNRVFERLSNEPIVDNRFFILFRLIIELVPSVIIVFIIMIIAKLKSKPLNYTLSHKNYIKFFILTGLGGSLPLLLTSVQRSFYLVPALPFFAIALALIVAPVLHDFINRIDINKAFFKIIKIFSIFLILLVISFSAFQTGKAGRDQDMLHDVYLIGNSINDESIIDSDENLYNQWNLQFYFIRYFNISIKPSINNHLFYLKDKNTEKSLHTGYEKIQLPTKLYDLYRLKEIN